MPLWRGTGRWLPHAISAAVLIAMLYLIHVGLQSLVAPHARRSVRVAAAVGALTLLVFALASYDSILCIEVSETAAIVVLALTVRLLWRAQVRALRVPLRATAMLLLAIMVHFLARLPLEPLVPAPPILLLLRETTMLLVTSMAFSFLAIYAVESRRRLHDESRRDVLTGLLNRRALEEGAAEQLKLAARHNRPCALLLLDLDHFKTLNDTWGHDLGDRALLAAGGLLLRSSQNIKHCIVARIGGEEFAMLLPDWGVDAACVLAERLCVDLAALRVSVGHTEVSFTASLGVSALQIGEASWLDMLRRADVALYRAKREGRNRVTLCTEVLRPTADEANPLQSSRPHSPVHALHNSTSLRAADHHTTEVAK